MYIKYKNIIIGLIWLFVLTLLITTQSSQMFLSMLFTVFVLNFSEEITKNILKNEIIKKLISTLISISILLIAGISLYYSFKYMAIDVKNLINDSQPLIIKFLQEIGITIESVEEINEKIFEYLKTNIGILTTSAGLMFKVLIGIVFGIIFHFSKIESKSNSTLEGFIINDMKKYSKIIFNSFKNIMEIQVLVSIMNTTIISFVALGLTYILYGQFLPYWYILIPLTALFSLIPVIGNIIINILLLMTTIQISVYYVLVGIGLFLVIHKLELIVIGKKMKEKVNIPFSFILISMLIGNLLFHSMSGMLLGMVIMLSLSNIAKRIKIKSYPKNIIN
jgi:predicted PurR-regulated permease PerM